jgi:UDP-N-acetylmuramoyl-tripeptide--D-alanyl-D-alanine ligase
VVRFSAECNRKADVWVEEAVPMTPIGHRVTLAAGRERVQVPLRIFGHYNVANLAAAAAAARCAGASLRDVAPALQGFQPTKLRSSVRTHRGVRVIADCYNANPQSMEEALASLGNLPASGKRVAVLGEMRELGKRSATFHRQVGAAVKRVGVDQLITFGEEARLIASGARTVPSRHFDDAKKCAEHLRRVLRPGDVALIKGSRLLAMERILEAWEARQ